LFDKCELTKIALSEIQDEAM